MYSTLPHRRRNMTLIFTESPDTLKFMDQRNQLVTSHILSFALEFRLRIQVWGDRDRIGRERGKYIRFPWYTCLSIVFLLRKRKRGVKTPQLEIFILASVIHTLFSVYEFKTANYPMHHLQLAKDQQLLPASQYPGWLVAPLRYEWTAKPNKPRWLSRKMNCV